MRALSNVLPVIVTGLATVPLICPSISGSATASPHPVSVFPLIVVLGHTVLGSFEATSINHPPTRPVLFEMVQPVIVWTEAYAAVAEINCPTTFSVLPSTLMYVDAEV